MKKSIEQLGDELCNHCRCTEFGQTDPISWLKCEGMFCDEAYENYLETEESSDDQ